MLAGFVTAVRTLTVLPCPGKDADDRSASLPWFPVVGLLLGLIVYGIADAFGRLVGIGWPEGVGILLVGAGVVLTRGLHLDGLADWADGFWGARDTQRVLAIMKDSATGAFGSIALVLVCLCKWVCLTRIADGGGLLWIVTAYVVSRTVMVELAVALPYARDE